jgi:hypothetical protein
MQLPQSTLLCLFQFSPEHILPSSVDAHILSSPRLRNADRWTYTTGYGVAAHTQPASQSTSSMPLLSQTSERQAATGGVYAAG